MKDDVYIGTRYLDGGFLFYGMFLFGLGIYGCSLIIENGLPETGEEIRTNVILLLLLFFGSSLLTFKGYKKYHANKKIDSKGPIEGYSRDKYE